MNLSKFFLIAYVSMSVVLKHFHVKDPQNDMYLATDPHLNIFSTPRSKIWHTKVCFKKYIYSKIYKLTARHRVPRCKLVDLLFLKSCENVCKSLNICIFFKQTFVTQFCFWGGPWNWILGSVAKYISFWGSFTWKSFSTTDIESFFKHSRSTSLQCGTRFRAASLYI